MQVSLALLRSWLLRPPRISQENSRIALQLCWRKRQPRLRLAVTLGCVYAFSAMQSECLVLCAPFVLQLGRADTDAQPSPVSGPVIPDGHLPAARAETRMRLAGDPVAILPVYLGAHATPAVPGIPPTRQPVPARGVGLPPPSAEQPAADQSLPSHAEGVEDCAGTGISALESPVAVCLECVSDAAQASVMCEAVSTGVQAAGETVGTPVIPAHSAVILAGLSHAGGYLRAVDEELARAATQTPTETAGQKRKRPSDVSAGWS